jgi:protein OS-9
MANHEGKHYMCFLPVEETKTMKSILPQNATNIIIESDRRIKPKEPDELLEPLKDQCFYRVSRQHFSLCIVQIMNYLVMCMCTWQKKTDYYAILMQHEGWWSYESCYHGRIRQVHVEGEKVRDSAPSILFLFSLWLATMVVFVYLSVHHLKQNLGR